MSLTRGLQTLSLSCFTRFNIARMSSYTHKCSQWIHQSVPLNHVSRCVHTSSQFFGLEEFFPAGENLIEDAEKSGEDSFRCKPSITDAFA